MLGIADAAKFKAKIISGLNRISGFVFFSLLLGIGAVPAQAQTDHWLTGYFAEYNSNGVMSPSQLDYTKLTHVIYWPALPSASSANGYLNETAYVSQSQFDSDAKAVVAGAHAAGGKALLGVGGNFSSEASAGFSALTTPAKLSGFVSYIVSEMQRLGFDGVDINWEEIDAQSGTGVGNANDNAQFVAFIGALRTKLNTIAPRPLLTMAPAATPTYALIGTETTQQLIASVASDFDQLNIQTYIMAGPYCGWEVWYNAPLNNGGMDFALVPGEPLPTANNLIASYAAAGIPMSEMSIGIQFDAATWTGGSGTSTGGATKPYQTWANDNCNGSNSGAPNWNTVPYRQMITTLATNAAFAKNFDSVADQSWLSYDPSGTGTTNEANDEFVSYDSPQSIAKKGTDLAAQAATVGALGGVMIFELSGDYAGTGAAASAQHPLLDAAYQMANLLPSAVTGLTATAAGTSITLKWTAAPFASSYQVYQSTVAGTQGTPIGPATGPTLAVTGLNAGTTYYFQVEPVNSFGPSPSGIATASATTAGVTTPAIVWAAPAPIAFGTPLSKLQLNATETVPGTFVYTPGAGSVLPVGIDTLSVTFTPSAVGGTSVSATQKITVTAATLSASPSFGSEPVGVPTEEHAFTFTFAKPYTVAAIQVLTKGAPGLDFVNTGTGTCAAKSYAAGTSCTVDVSFVPTVSGVRAGAIVGLGAPLYIYGTGTGAQIAFDPATPAQWTPPTGFPTFTAAGLAVDGAGNSYIAAQQVSGGAGPNIYKVTPGGTVSVLDNVSAYSLAVDGAGNLFYSTGDTIGEIAGGASQPTVATLPATDTIGGLAVDAQGNLFFLVDPGGSQANTIEELSLTAQTSKTISIPAIAGTSVTDGCGLAVDASDNLFLADCGQNRVVELTPAGVGSVVAATIAGAQIAVGNNGSLYIDNPGAGEILKWNPKTPAAAPVVVAIGPVLGVPLAGPIAVDADENIYLSDGGLLLLDRQAPPALNFASTAINRASPVVTFTVENIGNANLTLPGSATGTNPLISANYVFAPQAAPAGTQCEIGEGSSSAAVPGLSACSYNVIFKPTVPGPTPGTLVFTDNALNAAGSQQTVALSGGGLPTTLAAPATLTATGGQDQIALSWAAVPYAAGYYVYRELASGGGYTKIALPATNSYVDATTPPGIAYTYAVEAFDNAGNSGPSPLATATAALPVPTGLTATVSGAFINLSWKASASAQGYELLRGTVSGGPYNTIIAETTTATSAQDATAMPGTTYYYVVQAYTSVVAGQANLFSAFSNQASATTAAQKLPAPTGLAAYLAQGGGGANLAWNGVTGATSYNILRATVSGGPYKLVTNYGSATSHLMYVDVPLAGGTYFWVVQAVNSAGISPYSNQASLTVPNLPIPAVPTFSITVQDGVPEVTANNDGNVLFNFYRSSSKAGPFTLVWTSDIYNFTDNNTVAGNTYYYELNATNNAGTSALSAPQSVTVPFAPSNVKATPGNGQVTLSWTPVAGASSYAVYYGTVSGYPNLEGGPTASNSLVIPGLTNGTPYYFEVQATLADGISTTAFSPTVSATPVAAQQTVVWIPDYYGQLLQVRKGSGTTWTAITVKLPATCDPNSVAVNTAYAFVVCNANGAAKDEILVYNAATIRAAAAGTLAISPVQTYLGGAAGSSTQFNELIGSAFDGSGNLWVTSQGNNNVYSISAASLGTATPAITQQLNNSPSSPVGLAFATDGSLWITGQVYDNVGNAEGIVLNMPSSQFGAGGQNPRYCLLSENLGAGCQSMAGIFEDPEGIAVVGSDIWVANNGVGGDTPGRQLVDLQVVGGALSVNALFGNATSTTASPFVCPGGLFATPVHLWINDESYGEPAANLHCGGNGDVAAMTGGIFKYTPAQLAAKDTTLSDVLAFGNVTGRPGFGGIFVESDQ